MTGRKNSTPLTNRKLQRRTESPFTTPKRRLSTPENVSAGKLGRKGGVNKNKKKEIPMENVKKKKVTLIIDYFETLKGETKTKKTQNVEQLGPRNLDFTSLVTGNVIGQRKGNTETTVNLGQPGRSLENDAKIHHPIARRREDLRNVAVRACGGRADQNKAGSLV